MQSTVRDGTVPRKHTSHSGLVLGTFCEPREHILAQKHGFRSRPVIPLVPEKRFCFLSPIWVLYSAVTAPSPRKKVPYSGPVSGPFYGFKNCFVDPFVSGEPAHAGPREAHSIRHVG